MVAQANGFLCFVINNHSRVEAIEVINNLRAEQLEKRQDNPGVTVVVSQAIALCQLPEVIDFAIKCTDQSSVVARLLPFDQISIDGEPNEAKRSIAFRPDA
ncbi:MAG: hypothetical protein CMI13_12990 [Oleibacter sp.]|nr:hypothetical protein [Thalassolituus sp.]